MTRIVGPQYVVVALLVLSVACNQHAGHDRLGQPGLSPTGREPASVDAVRDPRPPPELGPGGENEISRLLESLQPGRHVNMHALGTEECRVMRRVVSLGARAVPALIRALRTKKRHYAVGMLEQIGDASAVPAIVASMKRARECLDGEFVALAVVALGSLGDSRALPSLAAVGSLSADVCAAMHGAPSENSRGASHEARAWIQHHKGAHMCAVLQVTCIAVGRIGGEDAIKALRDLASHRSTEVRSAGITGFGHLCALHPDLAPEVIGILHELHSREKTESVRDLIRAIIANDAALPHAGK
jgi:hypothetical protein